MFSDESHHESIKLPETDTFYGLPDHPSIARNMIVFKLLEFMLETCITECLKGEAVSSVASEQTTNWH